MCRIMRVMHMHALKLRVLQLTDVQAKHSELETPVSSPFEMAVSPAICLSGIVALHNLYLLSMHIVKVSEEVLCCMLTKSQIQQLCYVICVDENNEQTVFMLYDKQQGIWRMKHAFDVICICTHAETGRCTHRLYTKLLQKCGKTWLLNLLWKK